MDVYAWADHEQEKVAFFRMTRGQLVIGACVATLVAVLAKSAVINSQRGGSATVGIVALADRYLGQAVLISVTEKKSQHWRGYSTRPR